LFSQPATRLFLQPTKHDINHSSPGRQSDNHCQEKDKRTTGNRLHESFLGALITIVIVSGTFLSIAKCDPIVPEKIMTQENIIATATTNLRYSKPHFTTLQMHYLLSSSRSIFLFDLFDGHAFGNFERAFQQSEVAQKSKAEKLKEYDDMFDKDARERDQYYGKIALEKIRREQQQPLQEAERESMTTAITSTKGDNTLKDLEDSLVSIQEDIAQLQKDLANSRSSGKVGVDAENDKNNGEQAFMVMRLRKAEEERKLLQKSINLEQSLQVIRQQRQYDDEMIQRRSEQKEQEKQLAIEKIRALKEEENEKFQSMLNQKRAEVKGLKFDRDQSSFEQKLDAIDFFATRKGILKPTDDTNAELRVEQ